MVSRSVFVFLAASAASTLAMPMQAATLSLGEAGTLGIGTPLPRIGLECAGSLRGTARSEACETPPVAKDDGLEPHRAPYDEEILTRTEGETLPLDE